MFVVTLAAKYIVDNHINSTEKILKLIVEVGVIQNIISLVIFSNPDLSNILNDVQVVSDLDLLKFEETSELRILGFGSSFFTSGILNSMLLIVNSYLFLKAKTKVEKLKYTLFFIILGFVGVLKARTVFVGLILSLCYTLFISAKSFVKQIVLITIVSTMIAYVIVLLLPNVYKQFEQVITFGFELFIKYFEFGSLESDSTNELKEMYVYPTEIRTYLIGDGLWTDPKDSLYYKGTDVGYLRLIFYFGILGMISFLSFQFISFKEAWSKFKTTRYQYLIIFLFLLFVILNFKGFTDFYFIFILIILSTPSIESKTS